MTYHIFCYKNWSMSFSIVNSKSMSYKLWNNSTVSRPSFDYRLFPSFVKFCNFCKKTIRNIRSFFETTCHNENKLEIIYTISFPFRVRRIHLLVFFFLLRVLYPRAGSPQGVFGAFIPIGACHSPPPCGWSTGFIDFPRTVGLFPIQRLLPAFPITT